MARAAASNLTGKFTLKYNPYQQAFLRALTATLADGSPQFHRLSIFAGRRGGKTAIGAVAAVLMAGRRKDTVGWCVAPTYPELNDYVIPAVMRVVPVSWVPKNGGWSAEFTTLTLKNGSKMYFRSGDDPERMRGPGCHWGWFDETRKIKKLAWDTFRPALTEYRGTAWFTTSPNGFDWSYHAFYKRAMPGYHQRPGYWACRYKTIDNPIISQEEIDEARAEMEPMFFRQEYEAEFVRFEGSIYGDTMEPCVFLAGEDERIRKALPWYPNPDPSWPLLFGLDPGADHPFGGVGLLATPQGLVPWIEYRKRMSAYVDHTDELLVLARGFHDVRWGMDRTATQAFIELATHGITASAAENSVLLGIQRVQSWLRHRKLFLIEERTPMLVDEMRSYHWHDAPSPDEERRQERVFKLDDDLCDGLRYAVMMWPELPKPVAIFTGRDPESVPLSLRWAWEREQRLAKEDDDGALDWGHSLSPMRDFFAYGEDEGEGELTGGYFH